MDHKLAADSMTVERYLLGELTPDERKTFEEHAFTCDECSAAISDGIALFDNGRAVVEAERRFRRDEPRRGRLLTWVPSAVAAALAVVVGVQYFHPHQSEAPAVIRVLHGYSLEQSRGAAPKHIPAGETPLLYVNVPDPQSHPKFVCEVHDARGGVVASQPITAEQATDIVPIQLLRPLPAGSYQLVVYGVRADGNRDAEVASYPFEVGP
jgi:hypothetical protein